MPRRLTTDFVRSFFNQQGYKIPADFVYQNNYSDIPYTHTVCGYSGTVTWHNFSNHPHTCLRCNNKERITTEYVIEMYARDGLVVFEGWQYTHKEDKVPYTCSKCGLKWAICWNDFRGGHGCPSPGCCSPKGRLKPTIEWLAARFKELGYELRTKQYTHARGELVFWCSRCKAERTTTWMAFRQGQGCSKCGYIRRDIKRRAEGDLKRLKGT